ncbi:hypothetical protein HY483_04340 [Candidatus Woesearchaeota archaeon]|nr:hypothetical protein [Candidatus Woesearchaeota archaeon]
MTYHKNNQTKKQDESFHLTPVLEELYLAGCSRGGIVVCLGTDYELLDHDDPRARRQREQQNIDPKLEELLRRIL